MNTFRDIFLTVAKFRYIFRYKVFFFAHSYPTVLLYITVRYIYSEIESILMIRHNFENIITFACIFHREIHYILTHNNITKSLANQIETPNTFSTILYITIPYILNEHYQIIPKSQANCTEISKTFVTKNVYCKSLLNSKYVI